MTKDEVLEKYKELTGRKWRHDRDLKDCIAKVEEITGQSIVLDEEIEAVTPQIDEPVITNVTVVEQGEPNPPSKGIGRTKVYRVFFRGNELYWTSRVIEQALRMEATKNDVEFPSDTDFVTDAKINKCKNC